MRVLIFLVCTLLAVVVWVAWRSGDRASDARGSESAAPERALEVAPSPARVVAPPREEGEPRSVVSEGGDLDGGAEPGSAAPTREETKEGTGTLLVRVERVSGGEAMSGIRLAVQVEDAEPHLVLVHSDLEYGTERDSLLTGLFGRAVFRLPSGRRLRLQAWEDASGRGFRELAVEALEPEETRELSIAWFTPADRELTLRAFDRETGRSVREARVTLKRYGQDVSSRRTDASGTVRFKVPSSQTVYARVGAAGYTPAFACFEEDAVEVGLRRASALRVRTLYDGDVAAGHVEVAVTTDATRVSPETAGCIDPTWEVLRWTTSTDSTGEGRFGRLPSEVELSLHVLAPTDQRNVARVGLEPGELADPREVVLRVAGNGVLVGRLVDRAGEPVVNQEVWLRSLERGGPRFFDCGDYDCATPVLTDRRGAFRFSAPPRRYVVGPALECPSSRPGCRGSRNPQRIAPSARLVTLVEGETVERELVVDRELAIRGRVLDEHGSALGGFRVRATSDSHGSVVVGQQLTGGQFEIGPLERGSYRVEVATRETIPRRAAARHVPATEDALELVVRRPEGRIEGFVVDEDGEGVHAFLIAKSESSRCSVESQEFTGSFVLAGLEPGEYTLSVHGSTARALLPLEHRVSLGSKDGAVVGVTLRMRSAASLSIHPRFHAAEVWIGGKLYAELRWEDPRKDLTVPAGQVTVRLVDAKGRTETHTVELAEGEHAMVPGR